MVVKYKHWTDATATTPTEYFTNTFTLENRCPNLIDIVTDPASYNGVKTTWANTARNDVVTLTDLEYIFYR